MSAVLSTPAADTSHPMSSATLRESLGESSAEAGAVQSVLRIFSRAFEETFSVVNVDRGEIVHANFSGLTCDFSSRIELLAEVARRGVPEIVEEVAPLVMLAIPLHTMGHSKQLVAVAIFVQEQVSDEQQISAAARAFGVDSGRALRWGRGHENWTSRSLLRMAESLVENVVQQRQLTHLRHEISEAVSRASDTYLELGLLHRLTNHLTLSENESEICQNALGWLADSIPARGFALVANRLSSDQWPGLQTEDQSGVLVHGECPIDKLEFRDLIRKLGPTANKDPIVLNRAETSLPTWSYSKLRELVCVPLGGDDQPMGWLLALNQKRSVRGEIDFFGSVEIRLLSSVGAILGVHSSNIELFQNQTELFASSVKALTSAIDAKDPYTSGHSDRVARISVAIAKELGLDKETQGTIYLGGMLHDIGKIGIDDNVLNKPGQLTDEEFDHIKQHPQFGHDILRGVRQLDKVLPIVLHHHEAWNGKGYPHGLTGQESPLLARIVAVADSYDAMSGDRPYRKGMPDEKIDAILRDGSGSQWDAEVIDAFFSIREEVRQLSKVTSSDISFEGILG